MHSLQLQIDNASTLGSWLSVDSFASVAEISERKARQALARAVKGMPWRGMQINARKSGDRYEVLATSLPGELVQKWIALRSQQSPIAAPVVQTIGLEDCDTRLDPLLPKRTDEALWRLSVIQPLLAYSRWTPERSAIARTLLKRQHTRPDGSRQTISRTTLYEWVARYEEEGLEGLTPRQRKDTGSARTLISRAWD
ncbi:helix-turn-helix domain-containing protein, partial [Salmonella enterica]|nr:helix-turn-helix domain-containing protein [Salmonella enterica]